ncbi:MAG: BrxE family protein [Rhodothermales bacterium]|nr:BrxE family protein [Rhodothermales bacterium]
MLDSLTVHSTDLTHLLRLRLVVARYGEMDAAGWWNTRGMLGRLGRIAVSRGLPHTHTFGRARAVFEVARARCRDVFNPPASITLWSLPPEIEDQFDTEWHAWIEDADAWAPFFEKLEVPPTGALDDVLRTYGLMSDLAANKAAELRRADGGISVPIGQVDALTPDVLSLLAAGFARGERGALAIPYASYEPRD